ncbi:MAG: selenocysteine-specific translation elongation factor [Actinomycetota bacterium]|nr:selenocysteine-specific translation elongation factor [Actinomycetota bacterium]
MRYIVLGTAGHIDHGKSALVKALTGTDPDRLKEEKERGITIDLGFANLDYPDAGLTVGIIDVPGHERLIRNMLAGAGGIDIVLLVIAADEGIMPQSREHLQICELLKIERGIIAINKADLVEPDWLDLVSGEAREFVKGTFLESAEIVPVSAKTGFNLDALKSKIKELALLAKPKPAGGLFRLPVDRVFTLKGFGTVVTGTVVSGSANVEAPVEILPKSIETKIRGIHSHGKPVKQALAGQRAALNLQGVEKDDISRGDVIVMPGRFHVSRAVDIKLELLKGAPPVKSGARVHFHLGTSETVARLVLYGRQELKESESCYGQARLAEPALAQAADRFVIRRFSPVETIGGGSVLDPSPEKRKKSDDLSLLEVYDRGQLQQKLERKISRFSVAQGGVGRLFLEGWIKEETPEIDKALASLKKEGKIIQAGDIFLHFQALETFRQQAASALRAYHKQNPLKPGMPKEELRAALHAGQKIFSAVLPLAPDIVIEKENVRLKTFQAALSAGQDGAREKILKEIDSPSYQPPDRAELSKKLAMPERSLTDLLNLMAREGSVVRINESVYITAAAYEKMLALLKDFYSKKPEMAVSEFRDILGTTRKYALPFLEYLDAHRVTMRVGETRKLILK